jgi:complement component 1 Q subcomponent-binding protein
MHVLTSVLQLNDKPGQEEVELVRKFGDETIRVVFSISDLNTPLDESISDEALFDEASEEDDVTPSRGRSTQSENTQSATAKEKGNAATANDNLEEEEEFDEESEDEPSFPVRLNITIEKVRFPLPGSENRWCI